MKRKWDAGQGGFQDPTKPYFPKKRKTSGSSSTVVAVPMRAYAPSMVPVASRGYQFNSTERKVSDTLNASYNINATGFTQCLCSPSLGTDFSNRTGRKILLKSIQIRGRVRIANAEITPLVSTDVPIQHGRMIIYYDCQPNGANPAVSDILNGSFPTAMLNLNNRDRFRVICDKQFTLGPLYLDTASSTALVDRAVTHFKLYKKLNLETIFNAGNAGTVADISTGALGVLWIGSGIGLNGPIDFEGTYRVRYKDN